MKRILMMIVIAIMILFFVNGDTKAQVDVYGQLNNPTDSIEDRLDSIKPSALSPFNLELDRLMVNETLTKAGNDFYESFFSLWNWPVSSGESFIMVISEHPFRGISTVIRISVNDFIVFESFLQPRSDYIESLAEWGVQQIGEYLVNYENIAKQLEGVDVGGNGIY